MDKQVPVPETSASGSQWVKIRLVPGRIRCFSRNIVDTVESEIRLFADDCVCCNRPIANDQDCEQFQKDHRSPNPGGVPPIFE